MSTPEKAQGQAKRSVARNRRAFHEYHISDRIEAGLVLEGSEVKSLRDGKVSLGDSYADFQGTELFLINCHIASYKNATHENHEPLRPRKLLLHRRQLDRMLTGLQQRGLTLIPLEIYFSGRAAKVEIGFARGKKLHDKREAIKERDVSREVDRHLSRR